MRVAQRLFFWSLFTSTLLLPLTEASFASAQTVSLSQGDNTVVPRKTTLRDAAHNPTWISYADCINDDEYSFPVTLSGFTSGYTLEVWVGDGSTDCTDVNNRTSLSQTLCWKVATFNPSTATVANVTVRVQDIVARRTPQQGGGPGTGKKSDCDLQVQQATTDAPLPILVYFLPLLGSQVGTGFAYSKNNPIKIDLVGPPAPTNLTAGIGDSLLLIGWSPSNTTDIYGYTFFCDPPAGTQKKNDVFVVSGDGGLPPNALQPSTQCQDGGIVVETGGAAGANGTAGSSGSSAQAGTSGTAGASETAGTSGTAGSSIAGSGATSTAGSAGSSGGTGGAVGTNTAGNAGAPAASALLSHPLPEDSINTGGSSDTTAQGGSSNTTAQGGSSTQAGQAGQAGSSATNAAGASGASGTNPCSASSCPSVVLSPGAKNTDAQYTCGSVVGLTSTQGTISGLINFQVTSVAIAGTDSVGNVGSLSNVACAIPQPVDDFYKVYRDAGGRAGGGYCQASGTLGKAASALTPLIGLLGVFAMRLVRRRWPR